MNYVDATVAPARKTGQIKLHGPAAFEGMRKAGRLVAECLDMLTGEIKPGRRADIAIFNLDEIRYRSMEKRFDVPDGSGGKTWRFTRAPAPMRYTLVNGVVTFDGEKATGAMPGEYIAPTAEAPKQRQLDTTAA